MMINHSFARQSWIGISAFMVILILIIGGFTRLTGSGLSIVEWKPVVGVFPPLNDEMWQNEKSKYEATPEYKYINYGITLADFKRIYLTEYAHRIIARLAGLIFLFPLIYSFIKAKIFFYMNKSYKSPFILSFNLYCVIFLGILQGFLGWYMVSSGLSNNPSVSHYRLALHLVTALAIFSLLWYEFYVPKNRYFSSHSSVFIKIILFFTFLQAILGAFVAGLKAGLIYNTFPLMDDELIPIDIFFHIMNIWDFFSDPKSVQFLHRANGIFIFLITLIFLIFTSFKAKFLVKDVFGLFVLIIIQIILGVLVLLLHVPVMLALLHQIFVAIILASGLVIYKKLS